MASTTVDAYFSWHKFPCNRIRKQTENLKSYLGERWNDLTFDEQEEIIDDFIVDSEVRQHYQDVETDVDFPPSFPKLMIPSGEKIMVDETDLRTWRDAHSGPFSWKSKSQQDLTLLDLEPEYLYKPHSKNKRSKSGNSESENEETTKENLAPPQFVCSENKWTNDVLAEYRAYLETRTSKPTSRASSPLEEDNPAFEGSIQDVRGEAGSSERSDSIVSEQSRSQPSLNDVESSSHSERIKSPNQKKVTFSKSFSKDDDDTDAETREKLICKEEDKTQNVFCNPVMAPEHEWSTFVGQQREDEKQVGPVTDEPVPLTMDRGIESSDHSVESTPDHTSRLLNNPPDLAEAEKEEVIFVAVNNADSEMDNSEYRKSGFDFLDNW